MTMAVSEILVTAVEARKDRREQLALEIFLEKLQQQLATAARSETGISDGYLHALRQVLLRYPEPESWRRYVEREAGSGKAGHVPSSLLRRVREWLPDNGKLSENHPVKKALDSAWRETEGEWKNRDRFPIDETERTRITGQLTGPALRQFLIDLLWRGLYERSGGAEEG